MSDEAAEKASHAPSTSFTVDLHKWKTVMGAYRDGGHMYHATMPAVYKSRRVNKSSEPVCKKTAACE